MHGCLLMHMLFTRLLVLAALLKAIVQYSEREALISALAKKDALEGAGVFKCLPAGDGGSIAAQGQVWQAF